MVADTVMTDRHGYPRPMMERGEWVNLNGWWEFAIDREALWSHPVQVTWGPKILVPFAPETELSSINETGFFLAVWYRRGIDAPGLSRGRRVVLQFGGVD